MSPWIDADDNEHDDDDTGAVIPARRTDPETSHAAARSIEVTANNQRGRLLYAYGTVQAARLDGITDEAAMQMSGVSRLSEFSKRCSELREAGFIERTGKTRKGASGMQRIVCRITEKGTAALNKIRSEEF